MNKDRLAKFLSPCLNDYLFMELPQEKLPQSDVGDLIRGIEVPISKENLKNQDISTERILENMGYVIGAAPEFVYSKSYGIVLLAFFKDKVSEVHKDIALKCADKEEYMKACIYYRAALFFKKDDIDSLYGYARVCREIYLQGGEKDLVGTFKAEAMESFEKITLLEPKQAEPFYYLGYSYLNLGLYKKSELAWKTFCDLSEDEDMKAEIEERLVQLKDPVNIEQGYNAVISGKYSEGIRILEKYTAGSYAEFWTLWYYLGVAKAESGDLQGAIDCFKNVLKTSPSNVEVMKELMRAYRKTGDKENERKYAKKIEVILKSSGTIN